MNTEISNQEKNKKFWKYSHIVYSDDNAIEEDSVIYSDLSQAKKHLQESVAEVLGLAEFSKDAMKRTKYYREGYTVLRSNHVVAWDGSKTLVWDIRRWE